MEDVTNVCRRGVVYVPEPTSQRVEVARGPEQWVYQKFAMMVHEIGKRYHVGSGLHGEW